MAVEFRDRAIAAQSSSEALDQRVHVVPLRAWLALGLALLVLASGAVWLFAGSVAVTVNGSGNVVNPPANVAVTASAEGTLLGDTVRLGTHLDAGDPIAVIDVGAALANVTVTSPVKGTVVALGAGSGATVADGDYLATVAPDAGTQVSYLFVPASAGGALRPGLPVHLLPNAVDPTVTGYLLGTVTSVSPLPVPRSRLEYILADEPLADSLAASGPLLEVLVTLTTDASTPTGFAWTQPPGAPEPIVSGMPTTGSVIVAELPPYRAFFAG